MTMDVQIDFQLLGTSLPPKEITKLTGVTPDTELMRGERNKTLDLPRQNIWSLRSQSKSDDVVDHWESIRKSLGDSLPMLEEIAKTGKAKITLIVKGARIPSIIIPPAMAGVAFRLNAVIDIDHLQH